MIRPMMWHIYNKEKGCLLCSGDAAIEFDTKEEAEVAAKDWELEDYEIKNDILYYDGGYINFKEIISDE